MHGGLPERLDDDLGLLGNVVRMQLLVLADDLRGAGGRQVWIVFDRLRNLVAGLVGRVVQQHVHDEALLDGLPHGVNVEGPIPAVSAFAAEEHQRLGLRRRREGVVGQVRVPTVGRHLLDKAEHLVVIVAGGIELLEVLGILGLRLRGVREGGLGLKGRRAGLRGVGLVHDDGVVPPGHLLDVLVDVWELLDGRDDDPYAPVHGVQEIRRGLVVPDGLHGTEGMVEAGDGVLELAVEHGAVRKDDDR